MMRLAWIFILLACKSIASAETRTIGLGDALNFQLNTPGPVAIGNGKVLKASEKAGRLHIIGIAEGESSVTVGLEHYLIQVVSQRTKKEWNIIKGVIRDMRGLRVELNSEGHVSVLGQLLRFQDWLRLANVAQEKQIRYQFRARIHPSLYADVETHLRQHLESSGISSNGLVMNPFPKVTLEPSLSSQDDTIRKTLSPFGIQYAFSQLQLTYSPSVKLELVLAEIDRTFDRELGIQWGEEGRYNAQILNTIDWNALNAELRALEAEGSGQILAKPQLLSRSGEKAEFHAGGEIPVRITGWGNQNVTWKKYGIILLFQPIADHLGNMRLSVDVEVSIPNLSQTVGQLPIFETNRVNSHFDLRGKKTVMLSGLVRKNKSNFRQGLPFLSQIPILGQLFGSKRYQSRKTELVIFVTPEVVDLNKSENFQQLPEGIESL